MTRQHINALVKLFLFLASAFAGIGFLFYAIEHVWLFALMVFCLVCSLAIGKGGGDEE